MEDRKIYVPGNGYRVLVKKGGLWIGSMRFKSYNKAFSHASKVEKTLLDCTVLLVKVCKGELSLVKSYEEGRGEKNAVIKNFEESLLKGGANLCENGIRIKEIAEAVRNGTPLRKELTSIHYGGYEMNILYVYEDRNDSGRLALWLELPNNGYHLVAFVVKGVITSYIGGYSTYGPFSALAGMRCVYEG